MPAAALVGVTVAVIAAVVGVVVALGVTGGGGPRTGGAGGIHLSTLVRGETSAVWVGSQAWMADDTANVVRRFDPSTGKLASRAVTVGTAPVSLAGGSGELWVASSLSNSVSRVSLSNGRLLGTTPVPNDPVGIATGFGEGWVASLLAGRVSMVDPANGRVVASAATPQAPVRIAAGAGALWATGGTNELMRVDPRPAGSSLEVSAVAVGAGPLGLAVGKRFVYVACARAKAIVRVDAATMKVAATYHVGGDPIAVALWHGDLWVADAAAATIRAYNPLTGTPASKAVDLPGTPRYMTTGGGHLWVATARPGAVVKVTWP
jgi:DNA-binding beta-propeller fold protein YncE